MKLNIIFTLLLCFFHIAIFGQNLEKQIELINAEIDKLESVKRQFEIQKESLLLSKIQRDISALGFPTDDYVKHSALVLSYNEQHEQANWVMHMILPEILNGTVFRTNDFRPDELILSGSAVEQDYFLTDTLDNGEIVYDGFGYDRGHLAPSADFRWSEKALSESYLYSNMSPQVAKFNREIWAGLEDHLRKYVLKHNVPLYIITAPVLNNDLKKSQRSINQISIPNQYIKIAMDLENKRGIAFLLDNIEDESVLIETKAIPIDEAEMALGFNVFPLLEKYEDSFLLEDWFDNLANGDVQPMKQDQLIRGRFNTTIGGKRIGKESIVCGKVVSTKISRSGHLWLNIDKQFPNQIFSVFVKKEDLTSFPYQPEQYLLLKDACFEGRVEDLNGTPTIQLKRAKQIIEL